MRYAKRERHAAIEINGVDGVIEMHTHTHTHHVKAVYGVGRNVSGMVVLGRAYPYNGSS